MNEFSLSIVLIILASLFQGTFGLGMKKFAPLAWEAFWAVFSVVGMIIIPFIWASIVVPDIWGAISVVPFGTVLQVMFFGACWGIGAMMFGVAINYLGMSLCYGITIGLGAAMGSLVPLALTEGAGSNPSVPYILGGLVVMVLGVVILSYAGVLRDRIQAHERREIVGIKRGKLFRRGLLFAVLAAFASASLNFGFITATPLAEAAISQGAVLRNASLIPWVVVLAGGFLVNICSSIFLLIKKRSYQTFTTKGAAKGYAWALVTALLWFAAIGIYGQGAFIMGEFGPIIAWTMFLALALVVSNIWGIGTGEWKDVSGPLKILLVGNGILILAAILLGYANSLIER